MAGVLALAAALVVGTGAVRLLGQEPTPPPTGAAAAGQQASRDDPLVRLAVAGDVGTGDQQERRTAAAVAARNGNRGWDALVLLGDNIYEDGDPARARSAVLEPFRETLTAGVPLIAALGNHDSDSGHGPAQLQALGQPGPWFARRFGPVLLVVLDSNRPDDPDQLRWLGQTLTASDSPWTVAAMHHPMRSAGYHGSDLDVRRAFGPLFKRYGVQLVLAGHDHDYQRSRSIDGTTYLVSGAAAKLRPAGSNEDTVVSQSIRHFLDVAVFTDRLVVQAVNQQGRVFDSVVLSAP
ncbi:MAG: hypothetical protein JWN77_1109 [Frankiales bacterium]|nr:hypothetical protein [Frankiales bacterium]